MKVEVTKIEYVGISKFQDLIDFVNKIKDEVENPNDLWIVQECHDLELFTGFYIYRDENDKITKITV